MFFSLTTVRQLLRNTGLLRCIKRCAPSRVLVVSGSVILGVNCLQASAPEIFHTPDSENYITRVFTTENGLPQNSILAMEQTRDGYIWLATFGGLARYDGVKFKIFTTTNTPELPDNRITSLYADHHGALWVRSEGGYLTRYEGGTFTLISKPDVSIVDNVLLPIYLDKNDLLWFRSSKRLTCYNARTGEFTTFDNSSISEKLDTGIFIEPTAFTEDPEGNLWIGTKTGLIRYRDGNFTVYDRSNGLPDDLIRLVKATPGRGLLIVTDRDRGFYKDGKFTRSGEKAVDGFPFPAEGRNAADYIFFQLAGKLYRLEGDELVVFTLPNKDSVHPVFPDNEGNVWVGSDLSLTQYKRRYIGVFWQTGENDLALPARSMIQGADGTVLIHTDNRVIAWKDGRFFFPGGESRNAANSPLFNAIGPHKSLSLDRSGTPWIGDSTGLYKIENNTLTKLETGNALADRKFGRTCVFSKVSSKIFSSSFGTGLQEFENGSARVYTVANGLIDSEILALVEDRAGVLWIASKNGLGSFKDGVFTNFTTANGLTNNHVRDIYEDADGTLWIATYGGGLVRYRNGGFVGITSQNGLPEDIASRILVDDLDNFWVLGNRGVYSVNRASLNSFADGVAKAVYCNAYGIGDGMKTSEGNGGNQPAGWKTSDGRLWFPMIEGGIIIDPPRMRSNPPPVYIEEVILGKKVFDPRKPVEINPGENQLQINYTAVQFTQPEQIKFQYKMEGFDEDWQEAGTRRSAFYQFLPSGTYRFHVRAVTPDGLWKETDTFAQINVRSGLILYQNDAGRYYLTFSFPFNQYWWLYSLLALVTVILIVHLVRRRLKDITRRQFEQQQFSQQLINAHESERRRVAAELHDSIGQSLALIKNMAVTGAKLAGDGAGAGQFEKIAARSAETIAEVREITYNLRPYLLDKVGLTKEIEKLVEKIELADSIDVTSSIDNIDDLFSKDTEMNIYRIIQEGFNNVLKHSDAGEAYLEIKKYRGTVSIKIRDDGRGFEPAEQRSREMGFGLSGIAERVKMIGGTYSINSKIAGGTTILITLKYNGEQRGVKQ